ncbi:peptidoglycan-binding domain-containing protein [Ilumatobacter nonamiensis]|uniref:peptidoglycan-binding domain-containing protein n=1 Tax=Ilumatobacter nonamiensis TaxID=467093 RepID=UPI000346DF55|nr:peptidoglycan-binding domain-containing protein [Ilumatobacter nonamiensis]
MRPSITRSRLASAAIVVTSLLAVSCSDGSEGVAVPGAAVTDTTPTTREPPTAPSSTTTTTTTTSTTVAPSTTAAPTTSLAPSAPTTAERSVTLIRQGDEGPRVELVQLKLIALGYLPAGSATGVFDGATNSAVLRFQGEYGLVVDGLVGPQTERSISAAAESVNPEG